MRPNLSARATPGRGSIEEEEEEIINLTFKLVMAEKIIEK
jgi:hypothetical protein